MVEEMTATRMPGRSLEQCMDALETANWVRLKRSEWKRELKYARRSTARIRALEVISQPPDWALNMKALDLLMALPRFGSSRANKMLRLVKASPSKTLGGLSERQRRELSFRVSVALGGRR